MFSYDFNKFDLEGRIKDRLRYFKTYYFQEITMLYVIIQENGFGRDAIAHFNLKSELQGSLY